MLLPVRDKWCGLREAKDRRHGKFVRAMVQSHLPLIDPWNDKRGVIKGQLIRSIIEILGEGTSDYPFELPWRGLFRRTV